MTTPQNPLASPFGYRSTAADVVRGIDLSGKTAVITGGYSGIGTETVRALSGAGARVIVGARRPDVAAIDLAGIGDVTIIPLDLSAPESIDAFAAAVGQATGAIEILINNAAVMACPLARDARGYESQFATNHLGHFQLTARLWPLLLAGKARVVVLSSSGHSRGGPDLDDVHFQRRTYEKWAAYGAAKSANALFALMLDRKAAAHGVRSFAVDPGGIRTPLQRHLTMDEQIALGWFAPDGTPNPGFKSAEQGAATSVWCATSPLLDGKGGVYCADCNIAAPYKDGDPFWVGVFPHVRDEALGQALWDKSEELTGVSFRP